MSIIDRLKKAIFKDVKNTETQLASTQSDVGTGLSNDFGGARTSVHKNRFSAGSALPRVLKTDLSLDDTKFSTLSIEQIIDLLSDAHPDLSYAIWNFMRIANSGYTIKCKKLKSGKEYPQAEKDIDNLIMRLKYPSIENYHKSRSFNKVLNQLLRSVIMRGAASLELVMTPGADDVEFFAPIDPATVTFKLENDRYVPYQDNEAVSLDIPTFFYEGLDEKIDDPYGSNPLLSSINIIIFQLQVLNDIKAVVHNQGYPRLDITILEKVLLERVPIGIKSNEKKKQEWLESQLNVIINAYEDLNPDDTLVHFDSVAIGTTGGEGKALIDPEKLMGVIDNLIMSGLKTLSTILGRRTNGNTESFAKIEIKLYLQGVMAIQEVVQDVVEKALTLYLNALGKQAIVDFKFKPLDIRTTLEKAQFEQIAILNEVQKRDQGWISQEEAARNIVGHAPVSETPISDSTPTNKDGNEPSGAKDENPNSGGNQSE